MRKGSHYWTFYRRPYAKTATVFEAFWRGDTIDKAREEEGRIFTKKHEAVTAAQAASCPLA